MFLEVGVGRFEDLPEDLVEGDVVLAGLQVRLHFAHNLGQVRDDRNGRLPAGAGENAVDKWQRRYTDVEDDEFVESISYRETRGYVKRVLQNRRIYQALYADPSAVPLAFRR